jgi:hypothetical protein
MKDMDTGEAKRRAEWLNEHRAPKDWLIVTESEISSARTEFSAIERECGNLKVLLAQKTTQYEIAQKELAFIKSKCAEANFVFLDDLSSEAGHPEEVLAFIKGDVKLSEKSKPDFATVLEFESVQNQIEELTKLLRDTEYTLDEVRKLRNGDNKLIQCLAEGAGIKINCDPKMLGVGWEQFHDGVMLLKRERDELREALEHIVEYWNRDENETSMSDALWHIIQTAVDVLHATKPDRLKEGAK